MADGTTRSGNMDHGGEAARPPTAESTDLGTAGAVQANMSTTGTFHVLWVPPVAVFQSEHGHRVAYANIGAFWRQPGRVDDSALQQHRPGAGLAVVFADLLPVHDSAGHGEVFLVLLLLRNEVFIVPLAGSVGALFVSSSNLFVQQNLPAVPGTGHADGIDDGAVALAADDPGMAPEQLRRLLPFAGIGASSVAVNGLAAGPASPAVAFHLFLLLLGGLLLVILHVLRVP